MLVLGWEESATGGGGCWLVWDGRVSGRLTFGVVDEGPVDVEVHLVLVPVPWEVPPVRLLFLSSDCIWET